jgi:hypothetical protein
MAGPQLAKSRSPFKASKGVWEALERLERRKRRQGRGKIPPEAQVFLETHGTSMALLWAMGLALDMAGLFCLNRVMTINAFADFMDLA